VFQAGQRTLATNQFQRRSNIVYAKAAERDAARLPTCPQGQQRHQPFAIGAAFALWHQVGGARSFVMDTSFNENEPVVC